MSTQATGISPLERRLAVLLQYGTCLACAIVGVGLALGACISAGVLGPAEASTGPAAVTLGVALFILLPVLRLMLMLGVFLRQRDYRYSLISAIVLVIVGAGCALGVHLGPLAG